MTEEGKITNEKVTEGMSPLVDSLRSLEIEKMTATTKMLRFSGVKFNFKGRQVEVKGELPYHKLMEHEEPNYDLVKEVTTDLESWMNDQFEGGSVDTEDLLALQKSSMMHYGVGAYYWVTRAIREDEDSPKFKKIMTASARLQLLTGMVDEIFEKKTNGTTSLTAMAEKEQTLMEMMGKFSRSVGLLRNISRHRFKMEYRRTQFGKQFPQYWNHFYLLVPLNRYVIEEFDCYRVPIYKAFFNWIDIMSKTPAWKLDLPLGSAHQPRFYTSGTYIGLCFAAIMAKVRRDDEEIEKDELVHRLELLCGEITVLVNDLFSLERECQDGNPNNVILAYCQQEGVEFEVALEKFLEPRKNLFIQFENLYQHIHTTYRQQGQKHLVEYADVVWNMCSSFWPFHVRMERYSNFDISVV